MMERLKQCVDNEMLMCATLAYGASCLAWTMGTVEKGKTPEYFIDKALRAVRARLSSDHDTIDTWLLLSVYALAITEFWNSLPKMWNKCPERRAAADKVMHTCRKTCYIHLRALIGLVDSVGGSQNIHSYVLESMILMDKFLAMTEKTKPLVPLTWDPGPFPPFVQDMDVAYSERMGMLGGRFLQINLGGLLLQIILDVADYVRTAQYHWDHCEVTTEDENWLYFRLQSLIYRLCLLDGIEIGDNCVRLATLLFLQNIIHFEGMQIPAITVLRQLKAALLTGATVVESKERGLLFWCLCTGALVKESGDDRQWFIDGVMSLFGSMSLSWSESSLQDFLIGYLYLPEREGEQLARLIRHGHPNHST
jgi:hypothetical protein